jgi:hypothetical protein
MRTLVLAVVRMIESQLVQMLGNPRCTKISRRKGQAIDTTTNDHSSHARCFHISNEPNLAHRYNT